MKCAQKGFTLIEIMIVVAIIAILAAIAIPNFISYRKTSQANACISNMKAILAAQEAYAMKNGSYASNFTQLCGSSASDPGFLKSEPKCPANGTYTINATDSRGAATCTCSLGDNDGFAHVLP